MGMSRDEILGRCIWDLYPDYDRDAIRGGTAARHRRAEAVGLRVLLSDAGPRGTRTASTRRRTASSIFFAEVTERRRTEERLNADLAGMKRLQEVSTRLGDDSDPAGLLLEIVDAAIAITAADMGNIQLFDQVSESLRIVASRGFEAPFLEHFNAVHARSGLLRQRRAARRTRPSSATSPPARCSRAHRTWL